jgi:hypothetical protein
LNVQIIEFLWASNYQGITEAFFFVLVDHYLHFTSFKLGSVAFIDALFSGFFLFELDVAESARLSIWESLQL